MLKFRQYMVNTGNLRPAIKVGDKIYTNTIYRNKGHAHLIDTYGPFYDEPELGYQDIKTEKFYNYWSQTGLPYSSEHLPFRDPKKNKAKNIKIKNDT